VAVAYYIAGWLSLQFALVKENVTPFWPPTGIALVALLVWGRSMWPAVAVAALAVNAPINDSWLAALATAAGNTLAPVVAAELLRAVRFRLELDRVRDAMAIVFLAAPAMVISATIGSLALVLSGVNPEGGFVTAWAVWFAGDATGILTVAPFLLAMRLFRTDPWHQRSQYVESAVLLVVVLGVGLLMVTTRVGLLFLLMPVVGWAAWRLQLRGSATAALVVSALASWGATRGLPAFADEPLAQQMLILQAFNVTVALTSLFLSALVTERLRAERRLEQSALELEDRVSVRTSELVEASDRLELEIAERREVEQVLRDKERQLSEAQQMARIGSWEYLVLAGRVTWSDELFRIHGYEPNAFPVTLDRALEQVHPGDLDRIRATLAESLHGASRDLGPTEYRIVLPDGSERVLVGISRIEMDDGEPARMFGTIQDVTDIRRAEREHWIAETLQRSLLPPGLPVIPGAGLAARYLPASADVRIGGDWYDVIQLPGGKLGLTIGDVAGHGLQAARTMSQLQTAVRAFGLEEDSPARVLGRLHAFFERPPVVDMATLLYLVLDLETGRATFASAGHPPPLLVRSDGRAEYLHGGLGLPLGTGADHGHEEVEILVEADSTLLLYTDGLVERRGEPLDASLARLRAAASFGAEDLDAFCDRIVAATLDPGGPDDDVALLAVRMLRLTDAPLRLTMAASPDALGPLRSTIRRWLRELGAEPDEEYAILVACSEACTNAIQHPFGARAGELVVDLDASGGEVSIAVRDSGSWRPPSTRDGGRGLPLIEALMDSVEVDRGTTGTVVRMRRRLGSRVAP
jgi:integral membrane sensor domain MASE1/anti-sigma regulatory factor (Ser/Thr protein kinase)